MFTCTLDKLVKLVEGEVSGVQNDIILVGLNTLAKAGKDEISFLSNQSYKDDLLSTQAVVVLVAQDFTEDTSLNCVLIRVKDPYLAFAKVQRYFYPQSKSSGVRHVSAVIDSSADIAADVDIGACCVIDAEVVIASGTRLEAGCLIAKGAQIGSDCLLHPGAKVAESCVLGDRVILQAGAVIGSDGFGYAWSGQEHLKIPQVGRVILHDDVEIGANTCIDRGALDDTVIYQGVKLDNLVQIAHNVEIGALTVMAAQVGISGSTRIGKGCQFGGQAASAGHLTIGDGCKLAGKSGVISDLQAGGTYAGFPAMPHRSWLRINAILTHLPEIWKKVKKLSKFD